MMGKWKRYSAEFKAMEAMRGDLTVSQLATKHGVHQTMIGDWKRQAMEGLLSLFSGKAETREGIREDELEKLHAKIGQLLVEQGFWEGLQSMSVEQRRALIEPEHSLLSIVRQCALVSISRSSFYHHPVSETAETLALICLIDALGGLKAPHTVFGKISAQAYDTAAYKIAADALLLDAGVRILFHALAAGAIMDGPVVTALLIETKSGRQAVEGRVFIDGSGDGDLAVWAGVPTEIGAGHGALIYPSTRDAEHPCLGAPGYD